jgi:hypothetical protein
MRTFGIVVALIALAPLAAAAAPSKDPADLHGTWSLEEGKTDDPMRILRGERGRRGGGIVSSATIFGVPVGSLPRRDREKENEAAEEQLLGVRHIFEATYRLRIRRDGAVTEIRYGNAPTIAYRDGEQLVRDGVTSRAHWDGGVLVVEHQLNDGSLVDERYFVDARSDQLHWDVDLTRRKGSIDVERAFDRVPEDAGVQ